MIDIIKNIHTVQNYIHELEQQYRRPHNSVTLIAVSKFQSIQAIDIAHQAGILNFGENYLQEALIKISALHQKNITWHFIGKIQSNKTRHIAEYFSWVHTVDRWEIAKRLSDARSKLNTPLNICLQVNIENSPNKGGVSRLDLNDLAQAVSTLPHLTLRGLMAIPDYNADFCYQQSLVNRLAEAQADLQQKGLAVDTLSMGMSQDLEAAISMGSTLVRVGTAIFGPRPTKETKGTK